LNEPATAKGRARTPVSQCEMPAKTDIRYLFHLREAFIKMNVTPTTLNNEIFLKRVRFSLYP
jgi:hypothetical protein